MGFLISTGFSSIKICPLSALYSPMMIFINVDLPAPFSPHRACTVPLRTEKSMLLSAFTPGKDFSIPATRILISSIFYSSLSLFSCFSSILPPSPIFCQLFYLSLWYFTIFVFNFYALYTILSLFFCK